MYAGMKQTGYGSWQYKGFQILRTRRHGYTYYKLYHEEQLYSYLRDVIAVVDGRVQEV